VHLKNGVKKTVIVYIFTQGVTEAVGLPRNTKTFPGDGSSFPRVDGEIKSFTATVQSYQV